MDGFDIDLEPDSNVRIPWQQDHQPKLITDHRPVLSTREVGKLLGVSANRVSQVERRALAKCLAWCEQRGLSLDDLL
jgi:DNA-directed RNA polymerase sigma subunit (sigma70/sigma32)